MATGSKGSAAAKVPEVTWAQAVRDIVIAAINRGQLPALLLGFSVLLLIYKLPDEFVGPMFNRVLTKLEDGSLVGWTLFAIVVVVWYLHARKMRNAFVEVLRNDAGQHVKGDKHA